MKSCIRFLFLLTTVTLLLSGCANTLPVSEGMAEMSQTSVTDNPTGQNYPGRFIWHDLVTPDLIAAGKFYEELFHWQIEYLENYGVVRNNGRLIAGILQVQPAEGKEAGGVWIPSVSVPDVDKATALAEDNGGKIRKGPVDMKLRGRAALVSDSQSADIVFLSAKGGDPAEADAAIGDWLWDEIWTIEPDKTRDFYTSVLGYDLVESTEGYDILAHGEKWRGGIRNVAGASNYVLWMPVVRVNDPEETAGRVEKLGGTVIVSPDKAPSVGNTALISDPTGTLLLIQRWPSQPSEGGQ